ncbi:MAG: cyclodeaminase/cyclohydrolase family protein [Bacilli bacterium]
MKLIEMPVTTFLNEIDAPTPIPGGGSASAFGVAMGISLIGMVGKLTMTKKKYLQLDDSIKNDFSNRLNKLDLLKKQVLDLVDLDSVAYNEIMEAYRLPKETESQMAYRKQAIDQATIKATEIPLMTAKTAFLALEQALPMFEWIVKSAGSDFGVGAMMLEAGLVGAVLNVRTNMAGFSDLNLANNYLNQASEIEEKGQLMAKQAISWVNNLWK